MLLEHTHSSLEKYFGVVFISGGWEIMAGLDGAVRGSQEQGGSGEKGAHVWWWDELPLTGSPSAAGPEAPKQPGA